MLRTKKPPFGKLSVAAFEVHGLEPTRALKPDLQDLQDFLGKAELVALS